MDAFGRFVVTAVVFWLISVYVLYYVSKHLKLRKQDKSTTVVAGLAGLILGAAVFSLFPGDGVRFLVLGAYVVLAKFFYGCGWAQSVDAVFRTLFLGFLLTLPFIILIETLLV